MVLGADKTPLQHQGCSNMNMDTHIVQATHTNKHHKSFKRDNDDNDDDEEALNITMN
jgi:hypothetical protein